MSDEVVKIARSGAMRFELGGEVFQIDTYRFHDEMRNLLGQYMDGTGAELPEMQALCRKWGAPADITGKEAVEVWKAVCERLEPEKKAAGPTPTSHGTSASTPSA